jgi:hypothetical protein
MGLKDEMTELLRHGREDEAAALAARSPRAVRALLGRVWDPDEALRRGAARAVGLAAAADRDLGLEIIRRLQWALNDESATNGVYGLAALGEIGRKAPDLLEPFLPMMAALAWDPGLRLELLRAFRAVAETAPRLVRAHLNEFMAHAGAFTDDEREAFGRLRALAEGWTES